jgi:hypothetical protein
MAGNSKYEAKHARKYRMEAAAFSGGLEGRGCIKEVADPS